MRYRIGATLRNTVIDGYLPGCGTHDICLYHPILQNVWYEVEADSDSTVYSADRCATHLGRLLLSLSSGNLLLNDLC